MNVSEITNMRKSGDLIGAYSACKQLLAQSPEDRLVRISMGHCLKSLIHEYATADQAEAFVAALEEFASLKLGALDERMMNNYVAWEIMRLVKDWKRVNNFNLILVQRIFDALKIMDFEKPERYYSILIESMTYVKESNGKNWHRFINFCDWWNLDNLRVDDYRLVTTLTDKVLPSLAERVFTAYYKILLSKAEHGSGYEDKVMEFVARLDHVQQMKLGYRFLPYHKAKLLVAVKRYSEALVSLKPFVLRNQNEFWVWDVLGEASTDDNVKLSCFCRALKCRCDEIFLTNVRQKAAMVMHNLGYDENARYEVDRVVAMKYNAGHHIPYEMQNVQSEKWYLDSPVIESNVAFYNTHLSLSEDYLYDGIPMVPIFVTYINNQHQTFNFITERRLPGVCSFKKFRHVKLAPNAILMARFEREPAENDQNTFYSLLTLDRVEDTDKYEGVFYRKIVGELTRRGDQFGFVDGCFVSADVMGEFMHGDMVKATAILGFNKNRNEWGWKVIRLKPYEE